MADSLRDELRSALAGTYEIEDELGRGGMAIVYRARDVKHDRTVAVKVLRPELAASLGAERFLREISIAAKLHHPHILQLYDSGDADGLLYYVMPFVEGESLRDRLEREGPLPLEDAMQVMREAGGALGHAHSYGIVHRDVKPENILLVAGHAVVSDFGIARAVSEAGGDQLTETGLAIGTPLYMSPEQAAGDKTLDARSDVYSLACVYYEMLAGTPPFTGTSAAAIMARHTMDPVPSLRTVRSTVPSGAEGAVMRALAKVPADRWATAHEFVEALQGAGPTEERARRFGWVPKAGWAALVIVLLGLAAVVGRNVDLGSLGFGSDEDDLVAVLDFDGLGLDTLAYLTQAIPEFLALALTGEAGGPRAIDRRVVTRAWSNVQGMTADPQERYRRVADELGATHLVIGRVIRQPTGVLVQAELRRGQEVITEASVTATEENPIAVAEAVGVQLLAASAGEFERLPGLATSSTAAVRDWLKGMEAYRRGNYDSSLVLFSRAVDADTTFALAAWGMMVSAGWLESPGGSGARGRRLAWQHRDRLPPADSAIFVAESYRTGYPELIGNRAKLELYQRAVQQYPNRWDSWFRYGDFLWHGGGAYVDDGRTIAVQAFRRAIALDSVAYDEPWRHLAEHAVMTGDLESFRNLPTQFQDPLFDPLFTLMAGTELDPSVWQELEESYQSPNHGLFILQAVGEGMEGAERFAEILASRAADGDGNAAQIAGNFALNRGQPGRASELLRIAETDGCGDVCQEPEMWIQAGLYWDAEPKEVQRVRDSLEVVTRQISAEAVASPDWDAVTKLHQRCWLAVSDLGRNDGVDPEETAALARQAESMDDNMRSRRWPGLCASFLEALAAVHAGDPSAGARVAAADSAFGLGIGSRYQAAWATLLADMYDRVGEPEQSLGILRRVWMQGGEEYVQFLAPRLLRRARLAAELGYRDEAIQSYQHYLTLRSDPEPVLEAEVAQVREELAKLVGEAGRR